MDDSACDEALCNMSFLINLCLKDVTKMVCDTGGVHERRCVTKVCVKDGV